MAEKTEHVWKKEKKDMETVQLLTMEVKPNKEMVQLGEQPKEAHKDRMQVSSPTAATPLPMLTNDLTHLRRLLALGRAAKGSAGG